MTVLKENNYLAFSLKTERKPSEEAGKKYIYEYSPAYTKIHFQEIVSTIPRERGRVIIFGEKDGKMELRGSLQKEYDLRDQFKHGAKVMPDGASQSWFSWMVDLLQTKEYEKLRVYITTPL